MFLVSPQQKSCDSCDSSTRIPAGKSVYIYSKVVCPKQSMNVLARLSAYKEELLL